MCLNIPQVEALPTLILFSKGQVVERFVGYRGAGELEAEIKKVIYATPTATAAAIALFQYKRSRIFRLPICGSSRLNVHFVLLLSYSA